MDRGYAVEAKKIEFYYNSSNRKILDNINLEVEEGSIIGIVGLSGAGKTTLIKILNGTINSKRNKGLKGEVLVHGKQIRELEVCEIAVLIGTVFQDTESQIVFSCVEDEIAFGPENLCVHREEINRRISKILKMLNIEHLRYKNPNNLSGGEKQLVVIASILSMNVDILILDESMSQVDEKGKKLILKAIERLKQEAKTIIMIEHDLNNLALADNIYILTNGKLELFKGDIK